MSPFTHAKALARRGYRLAMDGYDPGDDELDVLLDIVTHYWMTNTAGSSARLYWESFNQPDYRPIEAPMGLSLFPKELFLCSERLAKTRYPQLVMFNDAHQRGGHFLRALRAAVPKALRTNPGARPRA